MKRVIGFSVLVYFMIVTVSVTMAQTQQGIVKTKGRLGNNGELVAGSRIPNVAIQVKGRTSVLSQQNGTFSFPLPSPSYYIQSVRKNGYMLTDPDIIGRQYTYSSNPLIIVLEKPEQFQRDRIEAASNLRRNLYRQYLEKDEELNRLLASHQILQAEYDLQKSILDSLQNGTDKLVAELAQRYAQIDYDQLSEFDYQLRQYILNGEFIKADSMLRTRGDIGRRLADLRLHEQTNQAEEAEIERRQQQLLESTMYVKQEKENLAQDCYEYFEIHKLQQNYDSAAYYIQLRAEIDTTNVQWQLDAGSFFFEYIYNGNAYTDGIVLNLIGDYYERALDEAIRQYGEQSPVTGTCYSYLGDVTDVFADLQEDSLENYLMAKEIMALCYGDRSIEVANCLRKMGRVYIRQFNYLMRFNPYSDQAEECARQAYEIYLENYGEKNPETALCCAELGDSQYFYKDAFPYYEKALEILDSIGVEDQAARASIYIHIANRYYCSVDEGLSADAQAVMLYASQITEGRHTDENGDYVCDDFTHEDWQNYIRMQEVIVSQKQDYIETYQNASKYYNLALPLFISVYGERHPKVVGLQDMIETVNENIEMEREEMSDAQTKLDKAKMSGHYVEE